MSDDLKPENPAPETASGQRAVGAPRPIPATLRLVGIKSVVDNVPPGSYIGGFEAELVRLFARNIRSRLFSGAAPGPAPEQAGPAATGPDPDDPVA